VHKNPRRQRLFKVAYLGRMRNAKLVAERVLKLALVLCPFEYGRYAAKLLTKLESGWSSPLSNKAGLYVPLSTADVPTQLSRWWLPVFWDVGTHVNPTWASKEALSLGLKGLRSLCDTLVKALVHKRAIDVELTATYERLLNYAREFAQSLGGDVGFKIKPVVNAKHKVGSAYICPDLSCEDFKIPVHFDVLPDANEELNERLLLAQARLYALTTLYRGGFFGSPL